MKPITDDIVRSILDGVEKREVKKKMHHLHSKKLRNTDMISKTSPNSSRVTSAARRVSGLFYYVTGQKTDRSETFRP